MTFTPECRPHISTHLFERQDELLKEIGKLLSTGPSSIHWESIPSKIEAHSDQRDSLTYEVLAAASAIELNRREPIIIVNIDDAFPAIRTTLEEWQEFAQELDYVNTLYIDEKRSKIIHWDFYKNLYAFKLPNRSIH